MKVRPKQQALMEPFKMINRILVYLKFKVI